MSDPRSTETKGSFSSFTRIFGGIKSMNLFCKHVPTPLTFQVRKNEKTKALFYTVLSP